MRDFFRNQTVDGSSNFAQNPKKKTMNTLPVSKKVYADITARIKSALTVSPGSAEEAIRMVDEYLAGHTPQSHDGAATIAFAMIRNELDRALERSRRARARAAARKAAKMIQQTTEIKLTCQQRRAQARANLKGNKKALHSSSRNNNAYARSRDNYLYNKLIRAGSADSYPRIAPTNRYKDVYV